MVNHFRPNAPQPEKRTVYFAHNPVQPELAPVLFDNQGGAMDHAVALVKSGYLDRPYVWKIRWGQYTGWWCVLKYTPQFVIDARITKHSEAEVTVAERGH